MITTLNTIVKENNAYPCLYGLCIDVKDGTVFVPEYTDEEPLKTLRSARHSHGTSDVSFAKSLDQRLFNSNVVLFFLQILRITDPATNHIVIEPFSYASLGTGWMRQIVELAPDDWILAVILLCFALSQCLCRIYPHHRRRRRRISPRMCAM